MDYNHLEHPHRFVNQFFPDIKDNVYFHRFPAYQRYSLPRITFALLSQCLDPRILQKLFTIKGDVIDYEREQQDLIYGLIGNYNAYVGRHLVSTFMLSQVHTLRLGSAFTESQFHASSSTLLHYLCQNSPHFVGNEMLFALFSVKNQKQGIFLIIICFSLNYLVVGYDINCQNKSKFCLF